ncbi:Clavaminate synthase-like protein [Diplocarpon rosae]|nr:Clavaminate synthase-like protein [Diplocarpon rosae]
MDDSRNKDHTHDTHAIPPQAVCNVYKKYQRMDDAAVDQDLDVVDFERGLTDAQREKLCPVDSVPSELIASARAAFTSSGQHTMDETLMSDPTPCTIYEHRDFPGLRIFPSLLPPECQSMMLNSILHRNLANPLHKTNLHPDYDIPFPPPSPTSAHDSFFSYPPHSKHEVYTPRRPSSNLKPLNTTQFLAKKLRWLTLGSQYDWTTRAYPPDSPTPFPRDIASLVATLFRAAFTPESGVVLLYSPKDFMPVHRDVSEQCDRGLASFSLGCDGLFLLSRDVTPRGEVDESDLERAMEMCVLRVRSGDCVWMGGETRWCWHAMPKVLASTCPEWLGEWPAEEGGRREFEKWRGYMRGKRLNLSCRQVWR